MNKEEAIKRLDALDKEAKELRNIIEAPEEKSYEDILDDYVDERGNFYNWASFNEKTYERQRALIIIAKYLQGEILDKGYYIYDRFGDLMTVECTREKYPETVCFKDRETALKAIELYKQYLKTENK